MFFFFKKNELNFLIFNLFISKVIPNAIDTTTFTPDLTAKDPDKSKISHYIPLHHIHIENLFMSFSHNCCDKSIGVPQRH